MILFLLPDYSHWICWKEMDDIFFLRHNTKKKCQLLLDKASPTSTLSTFSYSNWFPSPSSWTDATINLIPFCLRPARQGVCSLTKFSHHVEQQEAASVADRSNRLQLQLSTVSPIGLCLSFNTRRSFECFIAEIFGGFPTFSFFFFLKFPMTFRVLPSCRTANGMAQCLSAVCRRANRSLAIERREATMDPAAESDQRGKQIKGKEEEDCGGESWCSRSPLVRESLVVLICLSLYSPLTFWTTAVAASSNSGKDSRWTYRPAPVSRAP